MEAHHSFSQGRPKGHLFQEISTRHLKPSERFDFWVCDVVRNLAVGPPDADQRQDFRATVTSLAHRTGEMHYAEMDGLDARLTTRTIQNLVCDELSLFLLLDGQIGVAYGDGQTNTVTRGGFFLLDGTLVTALRFGRSTFIQLDLSRPLLESLFPGPTPSPYFINAALARSRLAGLLRDHLQRFPSIAMGMAPLEQLGLLDASESFALATIEAAFSTARGVTEQSEAGLFAAAQRYIRRHLANPELGPDEVAAATGCSRATLYRLFAQRNLAVHGYIRELRLQQFFYLLQRENKAVPIQILSLRCGLHDWPNVSRMFRKRFGMSPREARAAAQP